MRPLSERELVALTIYGESRGESMLGKMAVASVIRNRLESGRWGALYATVVLAPKQFSCWTIGDPNLAVIREIGQSLSADLTPTDPVVKQCLWIADGTVNGLLESTVLDARHYYAASLEHPPSWAATGELVAQIGAHRFYRGVK